MRALLFLGLVGAAIYGFLVISGGNTKESQTVQTQPNHSVDERLSSWGSYLAPSPTQNPQLAIAQQPAPMPPQVGDDASQNSERKPGTEYQLAASENKTPATESGVGSSTPTQVATESTTEPQSTKPAPPKANKLHYRSAKPTVRGHVVVANADHPFGNWAQGR